MPDLCSSPDLHKNIYDTQIQQYIMGYLGIVKVVAFVLVGNYWEFPRELGTRKEAPRCSFGAIHNSTLDLQSILSISVGMPCTSCFSLAQGHTRMQYK